MILKDRLIGLLLAGMLAFASGASAATINIFGDTISFDATTDVTHTGTGPALWTWQPTTATLAAGGAKHVQPSATINWGYSYPDPQEQSGGLYFDVIALYAKPSNAKLDFGVVISMDPKGIKDPYNQEKWLGGGDLKVKVGSTKYGIGLRETQVGTGSYDPGYWNYTQKEENNDGSKTLPPSDDRPPISSGAVRTNPDFYRWDGLSSTIDGMECWTMDPDSGSPGPGSASATWTGAGTIVLGDNPYQKRDIWYAIGSWTWSDILPAGDFEADIYYGLDCNNDRIKVHVKRTGGQFEGPIPEAPTFALFGLGALGLLFGRRRKG